ncbi:hypothetical protein [Oscillibacter sp.]|uniref:hypothetical protein n=1 Tax=Oscillibacter sp. TaxID=1945593 RepID=UPI002897199E|nr:hypothetical protein [Oscillibacter sp.]
MMELSSREMEVLKQYRGATPEGKRKVQQLLERAVRRRGQNLPDERKTSRA